MKDLGVSLKMITGDNHLIAEKIATEIGLDPTKVMIGVEVDQYSSDQLAKKVRNIDVFAEISPNQKEEIILAFRRSGEIVGYMGDGINDAPAIKNADVGISVDTAADTAKDAASIVLLKNDLNVLVKGILEGRKTFVNTLKYIFIATSANFGNMFSMAGASLFLKFLPLLPKQILATNLLTDFPTLQIAEDEVDEDWIQKPVYWNMKFIQKFMITFGFLSSIFDYLTFFVLLKVFSANESFFQTGWLYESILSGMLVMLVVRTQKPFYKSHASKKLLGAVAIIYVVVLGLIFSPVGQILGLKALPIMAIFALTGISLLYVLVADFVKKRFYQKHSLSRVKETAASNK